MDKKIVWKFTNQKELTKSQFLDYFERKIFRTIRKYGMLPKDKIIKLKNSQELNTKVLSYVLQKKFKVELSKKPDFSSENMSDIAEEIFLNIKKGNFTGQTPTNPKKPLYFLSDKEVELYASLAGIKGKKTKRKEEIQILFEKFLKNNKDLEHNIINSFLQLNQSSE